MLLAPLLLSLALASSPADAGTPAPTSDVPRRGAPLRDGLRMLSLPTTPAVAPAARRECDGVVFEPRRTFNVAPVYPEEARKRKVEGEVVVRCPITEEGRAGTCTFKRSVPLLDAAVLEALTHQRFSPGRCNGQYIERELELSFPFKLER